MRLFLALLLTLPALGCVPVESGHILMKHLAAANPVFASLDPNLEIGLAPRNGITRVFRGGELSVLARRNGLVLHGNLTDACFLGAGDTVAAHHAAEREVERGDKVAVEVAVGAAHLTFDAEAASSGRMGESIVLKNPENGRLFSAKIRGKGRVVIQK